MKLVLFSSVYILTTTKGVCNPDYRVIEQSGLWQLEVNDSSHSARITTQQDNLRIVLETLPGGKGIGLGAAIFRHNPKHLTLFVDSFLVRFGQPKADPNTAGMFTDFDGQVSRDALIPLIHALTVAEIAYFDVDGERLPLSLAGTSAAVNALDKYNQEVRLLLPPPFHNADGEGRHEFSLPNQQEDADINEIVASKAIGMSLTEVTEKYPYLECHEHVCSFDKNQTPQALCPEVGPCDDLSFFIRNGSIAGYSAKISSEVWIDSLKSQYKSRGNPKSQTFGPSGLVKMKEQDYSWEWHRVGTLTYTYTTGTNIWGAPLDVHSIAIYPK